MNNSKSSAWVCSVCGYVHRGPEPPDCCPVCGATSDLFEPYEEPEQKAPAPAVDQWRCLNCEYIHEGDKPPEVCPVCGAAVDRFEPYAPAKEVISMVKEKLSVVIVGAGIAGVSAAESIRKSSPQAEITMLSKEPDFPYYRLNLTRYLAGEVSQDQLLLHPPEWYEQQDINLLRDSELNAIDLEKKELTLQDNSRLNYEKLLLTAGSHPFVPPITGVNKENVTVLRTKSDADNILEACKKGIQCVCIGGGLLGLETAAALARRGAEVTILEGHGWLLPRQLNQEAGERLELHASSLGISIQKKARAQEIIGDERVRGIHLNDGTTLPAELVVIAIGVRSNSYLARLAGLDIHHGILVDDHLRTSNPDVYAAGDIAEHWGVTYGTWGPSQFQGTIAGLNVSGTTAEFVGIPRTNMLKVLGYDLFSVGQIMTEDASYETIDAEIEDNYFYFVFRDNYMVGAILLGDTELSAQVKSTVEKRLDCSDILKKRTGARDIITFLREQA